MATRKTSFILLAFLSTALSLGCDGPDEPQQTPPPSNGKTRTSPDGQTETKALPTAQVVLAKSIGAMGGQSAIDDVDSFYLERTTGVDEGGTVPERTWAKQGDFSVQTGTPENPTLQIWKAGDDLVSQAGDTAARPMEGSEVTRAVLAHDVLLVARWSYYFDNPRSTRRRTIDGTQAIDVELDSKWGERVVLTFGEESGHLVEASIVRPAGGAPSFRVHFGDHREYGALVLPTSSLVESNGQTRTREVTAFRANLEIETERLNPPADRGVISKRVRDVCKKMAELAAKEKDLPDEARRAMADVEKCHDVGMKEADKEPVKFKKGADCIMKADDLDGVLECARSAESGG